MPGSVERYIAYERVSTTRQGRSGLGLEAQRKAIDAFAAGRGAEVLARFTEIESGGRMIDAILTNTLLPELSRRILSYQLEKKALHRVTVTGGPEGFGYAFD